MMRSSASSSRRGAATAASSGVAKRPPSKKLPPPPPSGLWLVKSEPSDYSIDDLAREGTTVWDGVRNAQAQRNMRTTKNGDGVLFYHSSCKDVGCVGLAEVAREAYPDPTAEGKALVVVDLKFTRKLASLVTLPWLRACPGLEGMVLLRQPRLSVQPVSRRHWDIIVGAGG